jgi:hypothetical protein
VSIGSIATCNFEGYLRVYPDKGALQRITTLSENYKEVYFTNSYKDWNKETLPDNVKVIEIV